MANNKNLIIIGILGIIAVVLYNLHSQYNSAILSHEKTIPALDRTIKSPPQEMVAQNKTLRPTQSPSNRTAKQSDSTADAIGPFLKASYLNATLPANIPFRASKLDSPTMTAIQGTGPNLQVAIVAAKGVYSREHILDFISSQNTQIAVFDRMGIKFNPIPTQVKPKPESHLAVADLYAGQYINGDRIAVLVSPRLDKNGMYMVVIASPANQFAEKAKDLLSIYQSMIALPLNR